MSVQCNHRYLITDIISSEGKGIEDFGDIEGLSPEDLYNLLFELLCSRRVDDAVEVAQTAGLHRLAMLLSQLGGDDDMAELIMQQLTLWEDRRADWEIPSELMSIYRMLGMAAWSPITRLCCNDILSMVQEGTCQRRPWTPMRSSWCPGKASWRV